MTDNYWLPIAVERTVVATEAKGTERSAILSRNQAIVMAHESGSSVREIAAATGLSISYIGRIVLPINNGKAPV